jgi:hypothetical protein
MVSNLNVKRREAYAHTSTDHNVAAALADAGHEIETYAIYVADVTAAPGSPTAVEVGEHYFLLRERLVGELGAPSRTAHGREPATTWEFSVIHHAPAEGPVTTRRGFPLPFGHRHSLLGPSQSRSGSSAFLTVGLPDTNFRCPDPVGVTTFHTREIRPGRVPPISRGRRCSPGRVPSPTGACRFTTASPYSPPALHPISRARFTRHQRRFTQFTRPVCP